MTVARMYSFRAGSSLPRDVVSATQLGSMA